MHALFWLLLTGLLINALILARDIYAEYWQSLLIGTLVYFIFWLLAKRKVRHTSSQQPSADITEASPQPKSYTASFGGLSKLQFVATLLGSHAAIASYMLLFKGHDMTAFALAGFAMLICIFMYSLGEELSGR